MPHHEPAFRSPRVTDADGNAPYHCAVLIVTEYSIKGTERSGQEYASPLLLLNGEEYAGMTFQELHERISNALRGNCSPVLMELLLPDGTHTVVRQRKSPHNSGAAPTEADPAQ